MKSWLVFLMCLTALSLKAQTAKNHFKRFTSRQQYLSINTNGLIEPHMAIGMGMGNRFTERSAYFTELSYLSKTPFFKLDGFQSLHGFRFLAQYRYHLLQRWKPLLDLGIISAENKAKHSPFVGLEFRWKYYRFSAANNFVNSNTQDTLTKYPYLADAHSVGGAIVFGYTFKLSRNNRWQLEFTCGMGAKQKFVKIKNLPADYEMIIQRGPDALRPPNIYESVGMPYIPCTTRIRYSFN